MVFAFSKIVWWFLDPGNLLLFALILGIILLWTRRRRFGQGLILISTAAMVAVSILPVSPWLLAPLEDRFPTVREIDGPVTGIITLGGAVNQFLTVDREQPSLTGAVERITEFMALARRHPEAKLVYTGGSGSLTDQSVKEVVVVKALFDRLDFDYSAVIFEDQSRNTYENAVYTYELVKPAPDERWILITSANHMPRAVGVFRAAGWPVIPYPVDYSTYIKTPPGLSLSFGQGLSSLAFATKEWVGLVAYRLLGRTDDLFPGPAK